jgi:hypothetical protein
MALVLLLALMATAPAAAITSNPLGKVMELMDSLTAKITAEGEAEAKTFKDAPTVNIQKPHDLLS